MMISMHIPKTAGTSFRAHLIAIFGDDICFDYGSQYSFVDSTPPNLSMRAFRLLNHLRDSARMRMRQRPGDRCIHGHFQADKYLDRYPDARYVTWLRDPVERVVSQYRHWKRRPDRGHSISCRLHREKLSLERFAELEAVRNLHTRYFGGMKVEDFYFVGIQERYEADLAAFYAKLEMEPKRIDARNVNPEKTTGGGYDLEPAVRSRLEELNDLDRRLYDSVLDRAARARAPRLELANAI